MILPAVIQAVSYGTAKAVAVGFQVPASTHPQKQARRSDTQAHLPTHWGNPALAHNVFPDHFPVNLLASWWRVLPSFDRGC
jgi:hypothetical protein